MTFTIEQLSAYLDGELHSDLMSKIESALASDETLAAQLKALDTANKAVKTAFEDIADEPVPAHILALLVQESVPEQNEVANNIIPFRARLSAFSVSKWAAPLAASLAMMIGVTVGRGTMLASSAHDETLFAQLSGTVTTSSPLYEVLETKPSATQTHFGKGTNIKPTLTFETLDGKYCREFQVQSQISAQRGLACRSEVHWQIVTLNQTEISGSGGYQTASGSKDEIADEFVDQLIDQMISGDPLGLESEGKLLKQGWQNK